MPPWPAYANKFLKEKIRQVWLQPKWEQHGTHGNCGLGSTYSALARVPGVLKGPRVERWLPSTGVVELADEGRQSGH